MASRAPGRRPAVAVRIAAAAGGGAVIAALIAAVAWGVKPPHPSDAPAIAPATRPATQIAQQPPDRAATIRRVAATVEPTTPTADANRVWYGGMLAPITVEAKAAPACPKT